MIFERARCLPVPASDNPIRTSWSVRLGKGKTDLDYVENKHKLTNAEIREHAPQTQEKNGELSKRCIMLANGSFIGSIPYRVSFEDVVGVIVHYASNPLRDQRPQSSIP